MILRLVSVGLFCLGFYCLAQAQVAQTGAGVGGPCTVSALARMDGGQNTAKLTTAVCGLISNGIWALLDGLYDFSTNSSANALLNLVQNNYNGTVTGSPTFTANAGYAGAASAHISTNFVPFTAGGQMLESSSMIAECTVTSRTGSQSYVAMGTADGSGNDTYVYPQDANEVQANLNGTGNKVVANSNAQGTLVLSRTSTLGFSIYQNGNTTPLSSPASAEVPLPNAAIYVLAFNNNGTAADFDLDQQAWVAWGAGLTAAQQNTLYTIMHTLTGC